VIVVALVWLVPMFRPAFAQMRLPLATEILFGVSSALLEHHWMVLGVLAVLVGAGISYFRSEAGRLQWDRLKLNMPVVGAVLRAVSISRFCRILGTMLANGVPMIRALEISKAAAGNLPLQNAVGKAARAVESGQPLIQPLRESGLFSPEVIEMIAVAEESNNLERALLQIAETTERRTNRKVDQVVRLIEPLILVVIAGVIGFVAAGLLYPIFTMSRTLGR
jgi:general secretion pathway protein F/type IV pilus assembly protein PilC